MGGSIPTDSTALHVRIEYEGTFISMYNCLRLAELLCDTPPWALAADSGKCHKIYSERLRLRELRDLIFLRQVIFIE